MDSSLSRFPACFLLAFFSSLCQAVINLAASLCKVLAKGTSDLLTCKNVRWFVRALLSPPSVVDHQTHQRELNVHAGTSSNGVPGT